MNAQRKGVLVLDGTPRVVVAIARSLYRRGIPIVYGHFGAWAQSAESVAVSTNVRLPDSPADFYENLTSTIDRDNVDTLIPCSDKAIRAILPYYASLQEHVTLSVPVPSLVERVLDKEQALSMAERCGMRIPKTFSISSPDWLLEKRQELPFPLVAKPAKAGLASPFKALYFDSLSELSSAFERNPAFGVGTIFQELIPGEGVGISAIAFRGVPLAPFQHRRIHEWPANGGVGVLVESEAVDAALAKATTLLLSALGWEGPAMVEFRRTPGGAYVFLEVNGRFWGSLPLAIRAGLDFPYYEWQILHDIDPSVPAAYKQGLKMRWTAGEIRRLQELWTNAAARKRAGHSRFSALREFVWSFAPGVRSALFDLADMKPEGSEVVLVLEGISTSVLRRIIPGSIRRRYRQYRQLDKRCRGTYLRLWLTRTLGFRNAKRLRRLAAVSSVLFVCRGNIQRSPFAAAVLTAALHDGQSRFHIRSAGTHAAAGSQTDPRILQAASDLGITIQGEPQNITEELARNADLVIVMDYMIEADILTRFPFLKDKVFLLREWTPSAGSDLEILDPDKELEPEFSQTMAKLREAVTQLGHVLSSR